MNETGERWGGIGFSAKSHRTGVGLGALGPDHGPLSNDILRRTIY